MAFTSNMNLELAEEFINQTDLVRLVNANFRLLDAHSHISGQGRLVPVSALIAEADLSMNAYNVINLRAGSFSNLSVDSLLNASVFFKDSELFIRDGSGRVVQITSNGRLTTQVNPVDETTSILYGYSAVEAALNTDEETAKTLANTSFASAGNRLGKTADSIKIGSFIEFVAPVATGYYRPWVAVLNSNLQASTKFFILNSGEVDDQWVVANAAATIGAAVYTLFVRKTPLSQSETYDIIVRSMR